METSTRLDTSIPGRHAAEVVERGVGRRRLMAISALIGGSSALLGACAPSTGTPTPTATAEPGSTTAPDDQSGSTGAAPSTSTDTGATGTTGTDSGGATAPAEDDSASNDTAPPAGSDAEQFEDFCAQNPGAC